MKKRNLLHSGALALLLAACSTTPQSGKQEGQIDIVPAFENQTELKVSHLGKNIRYVPLETNDSSLIGNSWSIRLLEDKILVSTKEGNLLFDRQTGKFLREVSSVGQGPQEYLPGNYVPFIHPQTGDIYFNRTLEKMIRFNQDGKYLGDLTLPVKWHGRCYLTFDDDQAILHVMDVKQCLYRFGTDVQMTDSIVLPSFGRGIDFFQCAKGWFAGGNNVELCNAVYDKENGTLMMHNSKEGFTDDLTNFMPFHPEDFTPKGEYIGALNVWDIQEWIEEHPDVKLEGALAPLKDLADDANPVVVIVEP